jgi:iron complex outermembrane recepter protein
LSLRRFLLSAAAGVLISLLAPQAAKAESARAFEIPAGPLDAALTELADQAGIRLLFRQELVSGRHFPGLNGTLSLDDALTKALAKQPLRFRHLDGQTVIIEPAPLVPSAQENASSQAAILEPVRVTGYPPVGDGDSYNPPNASTATKTYTPLMETPFASSVVPQQVFRDQQITRISEALENVSGVTSKPSGINGDFDFLYLRGFYYGDRVYRDGVPIKVAYVNNGQRDTSNVARVEVLKGPPSVLYGRTDPGGMINLVTKQPELVEHHILSQQFGSYDRFRTTLDSTGPLRDDKSLSYRLNFAFEKSNSFRDFQYLDRKFFAPVLRWDVRPQTRINFEAEYLELEILSDPGLPLINGFNERGTGSPGKIPNVPISRFYGGPNDKHTVQEVSLGFNWSHAFNDDWSLKHRFNAVFPDTHNIGTAVLYDFQGLVQKSTLTHPALYVFPRSFHESADVFYNTVNLTGHFQHLGLDHTLLLGADYNRATYHWRNRSFREQRSDLDAPIHPQDWGPPLALLNATVPESWVGLYAQDQVKLPHGWQMFAGLRYDNARDGYSDSLAILSNNLRSGRSVRTHETAVTPRFGLLWRPVQAISWYGNYGENFGLPNQRAGSNVPPLAAERAHQWETGIKTEWLDGRLNADFAAFRIIKKNVANSDTQCTLSGWRCTAYLGKARSQGLELDVKGEILPQWRFIGTYTYLDTKILDDKGTDGGPGLTGLPFASNPRHMGSLWTTYEWTEGALSGISLGGGASIRGPLQDGVREPGYVLLNLMAGYRFQMGPTRFGLQVNIDNLLDKVYYLGSDYWMGDEFPGTPRTVMGRINLEW